MFMYCIVYEVVMAFWAHIVFSLQFLFYSLTDTRPRILHALKHNTHYTIYAGHICLSKLHVGIYYHHYTL